jgi:putative phosphoribosyl transferase
MAYKTRIEESSQPHRSNKGGTVDSMFKNRVDAGKKLASALASRLELKDSPLILALPRGGVPVASEVAKALDIPLDIMLVRKLGVPQREEFAMGAIASGGVRFVNDEVVRLLRIPVRAVEEIAGREQRELERRERLYRGTRIKPDLAGRTVVLVDDGLATGATMHAAVQAARAENASRVIVAVPTASTEACAALGEAADEIVCLSTPTPFTAVGAWYEDFSQTTDQEVIELLRQAEEAIAEHGQSTH